jgi:hypothetical protein
VGHDRTRARCFPAVESANLDRRPRRVRHSSGVARARRRVPKPFWTSSRTGRRTKLAKDLADDGPSRFGVLRELHLDDDQTAITLHRNQVSVSAAKLHLPADHDKIRCPGERKQAGCLLDQRVQRRLIRKSRRREQFPAGALVAPDRGHLPTLPRSHFAGRHRPSAPLIISD